MKLRALGKPTIWVLPMFYFTLITLPHKLHADYLLTSYLPATMQALAYYIDHLQYEPLATTTIEPPFSVSDTELNGAGASNYPTTTAPTTRRPSSTTSSWWHPPSNWQTTTTTTPRPAPPTPSHKPGVYAPQYPPYIKQTIEKPEGYALFDSIGVDPEGFDKLPLSLIHDIQKENEHDEFSNDVEALDNFMRLYDDNYGRATFDSDTGLDRWSMTSTAGKKRVPPTKPYVEFLLVYDLLKRDAKAANLSKYEGYSPDLLKDLYDISFYSAERQLYTLFKRMLDRGDIQRSDVVSRAQGILKELSNPKSITAQSLRYVPPLVFLP